MGADMPSHGKSPHHLAAHGRIGNGHPMDPDDGDTAA